MNRSYRIIILVCVAIIAILPIVLWGIPVGGDLPNHFRFALPFYDSIQQGHPYPGWLADSNAGYGDPRFRFYPPGLYYLLVFTRSFGGWYPATVLALICLTSIGSLGTYFWVRNSQTATTAMWAGILYTFVPYHLNELYQASLLAEYAACSVLPFVFAFVDRICQRRRMHDVAGLGAAYALLALTNLPLLVIGSISALVFGLARLKKEKLVQTLIRLTIAVLLGLAASSFFWVKMVVELPWIKGGRVASSDYYDYSLNFVFSPLALTNRNTWYANLLTFATLGFLFPTIILLRKQLRTEAWKLRAVVVLTLFSFFMATPLSYPLWTVIPKLAEVQFPWRWLGVTSLSGSFLLAVGLSKWPMLLKQGLQPRRLVPLLGFVLSCGFVVTEVVLDADYINKQSFEELLPTIRQGISFNNFLPVNARELKYLPRMTSNVEAESSTPTISVWEPEYRKFALSPSHAAQTIRVRTYYYPHWTAWANERQLQLIASEDGVTLIKIPPDTSSVEMKFVEPARTRATAIISGTATLIILLTFLGLLFKTIRKRAVSKVGPVSEEIFV